MGKLKISKAKKNKGSNGSSGIPNWLLSLLVALVVVAVVATCVGSYIASSGIIMRWSTTMSLDNYKVNGNMMKYFYQTTYNNYINQQYSYYETYASYLGVTDFNEYLKSTVNFEMPAEIGGEDLIESLKAQEYKPLTNSEESEETEAPEYANWYEVFLAQTESSVEELLIFCAEADELGVSTLTEEEEEEIEAGYADLIEQIRSSLGTADLPEETCLSYYYGNGVNKSDICDSMRLSTIASKASQKISENIESDISDELITSTYEENKLDYQLVDYYSFSFDVKYDDIITEKYDDEKTADSLSDDEKAEVLKLYSEKIAAARASAKELASMKTLEDFQKYVINYKVNDSYQDEYDSAVSGIESDKLPSEENLKTIKEKLIAAVISEVNDGKETVTDDVVTKDEASAIYDISVSTEFADAIRDVKEALFTTAQDAKTSYLYEQVTYYAPDEETGEKDELSEWAFNADRKVNDVTTIEDGDGANDAEIKVEDETFSAEVTILTKTAYLDESVSRNFAYMLFTDESAAKAALEKVANAEGLDKDSFLEIAHECSADAHTYYEDAWKGDMGSAIDDWLFTAEEGAYTDELLVMEDGSFMIALFTGENSTPAWKAQIKSEILEEKYNDYTTDMLDRYTVTTNDKNVARALA